MHLEDQLILRIDKGPHGVGIAARDPGPGAGPAVAFGGDVLGVGTGGADAVDGGLVEVDNEGLVHVVVFVVRVEDDLAVVFVGGCDGVPEGLEAGDVGDDFVVVAAVVVRGYHGEGAALGDVFDGLVRC